MGSEWAELGKVLKSWREAEGLTQQEAACRLELVWETYRNYESGKSRRPRGGNRGIEEILARDPGLQSHARAMAPAPRLVPDIGPLSYEENDDFEELLARFNFDKPVVFRGKELQGHYVFKPLHAVRLLGWLMAKGFDGFQISDSFNWLEMDEPPAIASRTQRTLWQIHRDMAQYALWDWEPGQVFTRPFDPWSSGVEWNALNWLKNRRCKYRSRQREVQEHIAWRLALIVFYEERVSKAFRSGLSGAKPLSLNFENLRREAMLEAKDLAERIINQEAYELLRQGLVGLDDRLADDAGLAFASEAAEKLGAVRIASEGNNGEKRR